METRVIEYCLITFVVEFNELTCKARAKCQSCRGGFVWDFTTDMAWRNLTHAEHIVAIHCCNASEYRIEEALHHFKRHFISGNHLRYLQQCRQSLR